MFTYSTTQTSHLTENKHVPDFAAFSVGGEFLFDFLWVYNKRDEDREAQTKRQTVNIETK